MASPRYKRKKEDNTSQGLLEDKQQEENYDRQSQRHSDTHVVTKTPAITTAKTNGINCMQRANNHELNDKDSGDKGSDIMTTSGSLRPLFSSPTSQLSQDQRLADHEISQGPREDGQAGMYTLPDPSVITSGKWLVESMRIIETDLARLQESSPNYNDDLLKWREFWRRTNVFRLYEKHYDHVTKTKDCSILEAEVPQVQKIATSGIADDEGKVVVRIGDRFVVRSERDADRLLLYVPRSVTLHTTKPSLQSRLTPAVSRSREALNLSDEDNHNTMMADSPMEIRPDAIHPSQVALMPLQNEMPSPLMERNENGRMRLAGWDNVHGPNGTQPKEDPMLTIKKRRTQKQTSSAAPKQLQTLRKQLTCASPSVSAEPDETGSSFKAVVSRTINPSSPSSVSCGTDSSVSTPSSIYDEIKTQCERSEQDLTDTSTRLHKPTTPRRPRTSKVVPGMAIFKFLPEQTHDDFSRKILLPRALNKGVPDSTTPSLGDDGGTTNSSKSPTSLSAVSFEALQHFKRPGGVINIATDKRVSTSFASNDASEHQSESSTALFSLGNDAFNMEPGRSSGPSGTLISGGLQKRKASQEALHTPKKRAFKFTLGAGGDMKLD